MRGTRNISQKKVKIILAYRAASYTEIITMGVLELYPALNISFT
jgi:hypothetical protein